MASQPPDTGRDRNQVRPLCSTVSSFRGKADRHRSTRIFGSYVVLDDGRPRKQAARFQDLLQQPSRPYLDGRANAESACITTNRKSPLVSMATSLSSPLSDPDSCLICQRLALAVALSRPWQYFQRNHSVFLNYRAFRGISSFTQPDTARCRYNRDP